MLPRRLIARQRPREAGVKESEVLVRMLVVGDDVHALDDRPKAFVHKAHDMLVGFITVSGFECSVLHEHFKLLRYRIVHFARFDRLPSSDAL